MTELPSDKALTGDFPVTSHLRSAPGRRRAIGRPSGVAVVLWFCADCGARLYRERAGWPKVMNVRAGTLDDTTSLTPVGHMFMKSAQGWVVPVEGAKRFETDADFIPLARKWRAMWPEFFPPAA
jgi:hypothetical protein